MTNEPKIDFKVLDAAIKKVLAFKTKNAKRTSKKRETTAINSKSCRDSEV